MTTNAEYEATIARLEETVAYLKSALIPPMATPPEWRLTRREDIAFRAMISRDILSDDALTAALYWDQEDVDTDNKTKKIVGNLRAKLKPHNIRVVSVFQVGYYIPKADRERFYTSLKQSKVAA